LDERVPGSDSDRLAADGNARHFSETRGGAAGGADVATLPPGP
jgi:hypothetical protein